MAIGENLKKICKKKGIDVERISKIKRCIC